MLQALDNDGETFLAEVHTDQIIYRGDPSPFLSERRPCKGRAPTRLQVQRLPLAVSAWAALQLPSRWQRGRQAGSGPKRLRRLFVRDGEKGAVVAEYLTGRVWDGVERARPWHLPARREIDGSTLKFCLSNAKPDASLRLLAEMQAARHFIERGFEGAKGACGLAGYQVRGFTTWHHRMVLVMVALMFLTKERLANRETAELLSCNDLIDILRKKLPTRIETDDDLANMITDRHRRRRTARGNAYRRQDNFLSDSAVQEI